MNEVVAFFANLAGAWGVNVLSTGAVALLSGLVALLVCLNGQSIGAAAGLMDRPDGNRKLHTKATPLVGGLAVICSVAVGGLYLVTVRPEVAGFVGPSAAVVAAAFTIGTADDRSHVCPWRRLLSLAALAAVTVAFVPALNVRLLHFDLPGIQMGLWWLSVPFTVFALLCLKNGLNMADGVDGLAPGIALGWFALILPWAHSYAPEVAPIVLVALAGMAVVFLFNWFGAVFLGDAGTYGLSFLAGLMGIYVYNRAGGALPAELVALWFLIPVLDMGRLLVQRMAAGKHPFEPDRNHLHHMLLQVLDKRAAVLTYLALVVLPPALVTMEGRLLPFAIVGSFAGYLGLLALGRRAPEQRSWQVYERTSDHV